MATYRPPGVYVVDNTTPVYSSSNVVPSSVGIFGAPAESLTSTETLQLPPDDSEGKVVETEQLAFPNATNVKVFLSPTNQELVEDTDFELVSRDSGEDSYTSVKRIDTSELLTETGGTIVVTYNYSPANANKALRFSEPYDVEGFYGPAFDSDGNISSEVTLAAQLAFLNGAPSVIVAASKDSSEQAYIDALRVLNKAKDVAVIVTTSDNNNVINAVSEAVTHASNNEMERRAIVGADGSSTPVDIETLTTYAASLSNKRVAFVAPSFAIRRASTVNKDVNVGGQYIAAAIAGRAVSQAVQEPLTRKVVSGFLGLDDSLSISDKNNLSASGVMVVEQTAQGITRIRHGVTTDNTTKNNSEWSVVGATDQLVSGVRNMLDSSGFIGSAITSGTVPAITGMLDSMLTSSVTDGVILDYDSLTVRQRPEEHDIIDVRFAISYLFPLNRIYVTMTSSATTGDTTTTITG